MIAGSKDLAQFFSELSPPEGAPFQIFQALFRFVEAKVNTVNRCGIILTLIFFSSGCDQKPTNLHTSATVSFAGQVQPIFDANCVQCHVREAPQGGLVLEEGSSYQMLVSKKSSSTDMVRVQPGAPERSYLFHKLMGTQMQAKGSGLGMPLTEGVYSQLPPKDIATISAWIEAGALDN